ncbi:haloacid dehalogenase [Myxococcus fulvus 124B02]|nr:haloacid dehalogenase [Myxococcus fulvus 124B02]
MRKKGGQYADKRWMDKPRAFGKYGPVRPKALFFDVDDTLIDREGAFTRYFELFMARFPDVFPAHRRAEDLATLRVLDERGGRDRQAFFQDLLERFPVGLSEKALRAEFHVGLARQVTSDPALVAWVAARAGRQPVVVVSNGAADTQRMKLLHAGLYHCVPQGFFSSEVGVEKPDPAIFQAALKHVNRAPSEVLHVGDDPVRDIVGAGRLGITTCWVSHGREWPASLPPPDFTVERVSMAVQDLERVLSSWT